MPREKDKEKETWRVYERGGKKRRGKEEGDEKEVKWSACIFIFCLFCHKLFKGYVLPTTHLGMGVKVEEFLMLFSRKPLNLFCWLFFFLLLFPLSHHLALSLSRSPSLTKTWQLLSSRLILAINFTSCVLCSFKRLELLPHGHMPLPSSQVAVNIHVCHKGKTLAILLKCIKCAYVWLIKLSLHNAVAIGVDSALNMGNKFQNSTQQLPNQLGLLNNRQNKSFYRMF